MWGIIVVPERHPAENHVLLFEDEPSHCLRETGKVWKLQASGNQRGTSARIIARREPKRWG